MAKHTPTPWAVAEGRYFPNSPTPVYGPGRLSEATKVCGATPEDAALIVRAVNSHDDLVAAMHSMLGVISYLHETGDIRDSLRNDAQAIEEARSALAKAES